MGTRTMTDDCTCTAGGNPLHDESVRRGVHHRCWRAGPDRACAKCVDIIMDVMHNWYGNVDNDRLRTVIHTDLLGGRL
jgi:hypothetical protein